MPRVRNPYGYNDPAMAQAAVSLGEIFFGGESPNEAKEREAKQALMAAQTESARAQAGKYGAEADSVRNRLGYQNERAYRRAAMLAQGLDPDAFDAATADPAVTQNINRTVGQLLTQIGLTGDTNFEQFQKGVTVADDRRLGEDVLAGRRDAGDVGQAMAARDGKPLVDVSDGMRFSQFLMDEPMTTTPVGQARISASGAQAARDRAAADASTAQAENYRAQAGKYRAEAGQVGQKDRVAIPFNVAGQIDSEINAQLGVAMDKDGNLLPGSALPLTPDDMTRVRLRAAEIQQRIENGPAAVAQALREMGEMEEVGAGTKWFGLRDTPPTARGFKSVGSLVADQPQPQPPAPQNNSAKLMQEANDAIARGADPAKVRERLMQLGVSIGE